MACQCSGTLRFKVRDQFVTRTLALTRTLTLPDPDPDPDPNPDPSKVGDQVMAKVGRSSKAAGPDGYCLGTVIKEWDQGNAYRIELQDGNKTNVWGPIDEDNFVKAAAA